MEEKSISLSIKKMHRISYLPNEEPTIEVFTLEPDSVTLLETFLVYINEWHALGITPSKLSSSLAFNYKKGVGTKIESNPPDPLQLSALYNALRPFVLQKESTHYYKIVKTLA